MKITIPLFLVVIYTMLTTPANSLQVRVFPEEPVYIELSNPDRGYADLMLHNIIFINDSTQDVTIEKVLIEIIEGQSVVLTRLLTKEEIQRTAEGISEAKNQGMQAFVDIDFPWNQVLGEKILPANGISLAPRHAALAQKIFLTVSGLPTAVRVHAFAKDEKGKSIEATTELKVFNGQSPNKYHFPLQGVWFMRSVPNITSHHRWHYDTEFAVDFWRVGENGFPWKTDGSSANDFYGFGAPVLATADGVVVAAENNATQDWQIRVKKKGESEEDYGLRLNQYAVDTMKTDPHKALMGNYVVLQHAGGEYSCYAHLKTGTVKVKVGDHVTAGQPMAEVGDTGDTNLVHLHFQISDGPDPLKARSIPFEFIDLRRTDPDLGRFVRVATP